MEKACLSHAALADESDDGRNRSSSRQRREILSNHGKLGASPGKQSPIFDVTNEVVRICSPDQIGH
jgi:hypothetical protein